MFGLKRGVVDLLLVLLIAIGVGLGYLMVRDRIVHELTFTWTPDRDDTDYQVFGIFDGDVSLMSDDTIKPGYRVVLKPDQDRITVDLRKGTYRAGVRACRADGACRGWGQTRFDVPGAKTVRVETSHLHHPEFRFW